MHIYDISSVDAACSAGSLCRKAGVELRTSFSVSLSIDVRCSKAFFASDPQVFSRRRGLPGPMSAVGSPSEPFEAWQERFPSLINCATVDWYDPWPEDCINSSSCHQNQRRCSPLSPMFPVAISSKNGRTPGRPGVRGLPVLPGGS